MPALISGITGVLAAFKATAVGAWLTGTFTGRLLASVALSALQSALLAPQQQAGGFTSQYTANGGTNPCSFVLGLYGIGGQNACPPMTHGKAGKTPNAYLTYVIKLGDVPGQSLERVMIDGAYVARGASPHPDYGLPATGRYAGYAWFKFYDGSQTVADPMLLAKYGAYPERPWLADMVGTGTPYVICTFRFNRELFGGLPTMLFECGGIPLYDPRFDTTVGGSGPQRWGTVSTYVRSTNNAVIDYNIACGITIPQLGVWGGDFIAEDLPLGNWFAAMNACDLMVGSPLRKQFQGGYPVQVTMEPATVMEEFGKGCTAQFAEVGGQLKMRVGGPGLPVLFITDGDIIVSRPQDFQPFPNAASRQNGIEARFAEPAIGWKDKAAPPRYNATWEAEDGARRTTSVDLPACSDSDQAQRVMAAYITDARRARSHGLTLPPDAAILEPLDVISWTSTWNTYTAKLFEVSQLADDMLTMLQRISVRECDPADFTPPAGLVSPASPSSAPAIPVAQTLPGWSASGYIVADGASVARAPGGIGIWDGAELDDATGVQYQVRVAATAQVIIEGVVSNVADGRAVVSAGMLRKTGYEMRALLLVEGRATSWTAWTYFLSPDIAPVQVGDIGNNAVLSQHTTLIPGNMVSNPQFATADQRDWRPYGAPAATNQSVVSRATAGVPAGAPTANVMRYNFGVSGATQISTFGGATAYDGQNAADCAIPTIAGQTYRLTIDAVKSATGTLTGFDLLMFYLGADGSIGNYLTAISALATLSTSWATYSGTYVAPAGTVAVWPYVFGNMTGTGEVYWTNVNMRTMATAALIGSNAVTRPAVLVDTMSDTVRGALIGPITTPVSGSEVLRIATGPIVEHQLWRAGLSLEHYVSGGQSQVLAMQKRFKFSGVWGPWTEVSTVSASLAWDADGISTGFSANYEDAEFRLYVNSRSGSVPANNLRNIRLTATNVVR